MANATLRDTRAGFDLYRTAGGNISLEDLNVQLVEAGYGPIAKRTYVHYRHLVEAGYSRYISINRFDIARAATPFENASGSSRYSYTQADLGVRVIFAKSSKLLEALGRAGAIGEAGAMLRFEESEVVAGLRRIKPQPGDMVTLRYLEAGRTVGGRVVEADVKASPANVEVEFTDLLSVAAIGLGQALPAAESTFVLRGPGTEPQTLEGATQRIYQFFELVEGLRALANESGARQPGSVYAPPATLRRLSVASPAEVVISVAEQVTALLPLGLVAALLRAVWAIPEKRKAWYEGTAEKKRNEMADLDLRDKGIDVELKELGAERDRAERALEIELLNRVRASFERSQIDDEAIRRLIENHVLPPLRALGSTGVLDIAPPDPEEDQSDSDSDET